MNPRLAQTKNANQTRKSIRICVAFLKGGGARTTTAMNLAAALAFLFPEDRILLVDTDPKNSSAMGWHKRAIAAGEKWPENLEVRAIARDFMVDEVNEAMDSGEFQHLVIDTGNDGDVVDLAMSLCHQVVIPITPSTMEFPQINPTLKIAFPYASEGKLHVSGIITRVPPNSTQGEQAAAALAAGGLDILATQLGYWSRFLNQSGTGFPTAARTRPYDEILSELLTKETA